MADPEKEAPEESTEASAPAEAAPEDLVVEEGAESIPEAEPAFSPEQAEESAEIADSAEEAEAVAEAEPDEVAAEIEPEEGHAEFELVEENAAESEEGAFAPVESDEEPHDVFGQKSDSPADAVNEHAEIADALGGFSGVFGGSKPSSPSASPLSGGASVQSDAVPAQGGGGGGAAFLLLLTWASMATILAFWLWWTRPPVPSNLEDLPDDGKLQVRNASGNKRIVLPTEALSDRLTIPLNETRRLGDLEITPRAVEYRRVKLLSESGKVIAEPRALALKLELKNVAKDYDFCPTDPQFLHLVDRGSLRARRPLKLSGQVIFEDGYTYTFLHAPGDEGSLKKRILPYDVTDLTQKMEGESFTKLKPGEKTETWVFSEEDCIDRVQPAMIWRVKLRKGKARRGKGVGVGVATVVGVSFRRDQVADKSKNEQDS